jgi:hypothetical protein
MRLRPAAPLLALLTLAGCYGYRVETTPAAEYVVAARPDRIELTRTDRTKVEVFNPAVVGDSIRGLPTEKAIRPIMVPLSEVVSVGTRQFSWKKTLGFAGIVVASLALYQLLMGLNEY